MRMTFDKFSTHKIRPRIQALDRRDLFRTAGSYANFIGPLVTYCTWRDGSWKPAQLCEDRRCIPCILRKAGGSLKATRRSHLCTQSTAYHALEHHHPAIMMLTDLTIRKNHADLRARPETSAAVAGPPPPPAGRFFPAVAQKPSSPFGLLHLKIQSIMQSAPRVELRLTPRTCIPAAQVLVHRQLAPTSSTQHNSRDASFGPGPDLRLVARQRLVTANTGVVSPAALVLDGDHVAF